MQLYQGRYFETPKDTTNMTQSTYTFKTKDMTQRTYKFCSHGGIYDAQDCTKRERRDPSS